MHSSGHQLTVQAASAHACWPHLCRPLGPADTKVRIQLPDAGVREVCDQLARSTPCATSEDRHRAGLV